MRGLLTFVLGIVILIVKVIAAVVIGFTIGVVWGMSGLGAENTLLQLLAFAAILVFVELPYSLITTYFIYTTLNKINAKRFGILGGPFSSGVLCWLFNIFSLPYCLLTKVFPLDYESEPSGEQFDKSKFIAGWIVGLILVLAIMAIRSALKRY